VAARTAAPAEPEAAPVPHKPPVIRPDSPVLAWPAEWPVPQPPTEAKRRARGGRGLPMTPTLAAAGNATTLTATAAYESAGVAGLAATGVVAVAGGVAAVARRRRTVKRNMSQRAAPGLGDNSRRFGGAGAMRSGGSFTSPTSRTPSAKNSVAKSGGTDSASRRSGPRNTTPWGAAPGDKTNTAKNLGASGVGDRPGRHQADKKHPKKRKPLSGSGKSAGLKAAAVKAARNAAKPGSTPRKTLAAARHGAAGVAKGGYRAAKATGRGIKKAWTADRAKRVRERAKKLRGAGTDAARAVAAAAWTGLRKRSPRAALTRLREVWARLRKKRGDKEAAKAEKAADAAAAVKPGVADSVRRPTSTAIPATFAPEGAAMSGHHFTAPAMEMARIAAAYDPGGMLQVGEDFSGLEDALRLTAEAMKVTVENADAKFPLAPQIVEMMRQIHSLQLKAAEMAGELRPAFENLHQVDLERLRNPRKGAAGEAMWDVRSNL
jgi:hypothetical protein